MAINSEGQQANKQHRYHLVGQATKACPSALPSYKRVHWAAMLTSWIWRYHIFDSSALRILMKLSIWKYLHTTALVRKVRRHVELTGLRCRPPIDKWRRLLKTDMCRLKRCVAYRDFEGRSLFSLTWYSSVTATVHVEALCFINIIITVVGIIIITVIIGKHLLTSQRCNGLAVKEGSSICVLPSGG